MTSEQFDDICSKIRSVSGLSEPLNYCFDGPDDDKNLFARIIRGELPQYRVWEDDEHVAFLTRLLMLMALLFWCLEPISPVTSFLLRSSPTPSLWQQRTKWLVY